MNKIVHNDIEEKLSNREKILCLYKTNDCYLYKNQYIICEHYNKNIIKKGEFKIENIKNYQNDKNKNNNENKTNNENDYTYKKFEFMLYL
jgi:hypothetical protein